MSIDKPVLVKVIETTYSFGGILEKDETLYTYEFDDEGNIISITKNLTYTFNDYEFDENGNAVYKNSEDPYVEIYDPENYKASYDEDNFVYLESNNGENDFIQLLDDHHNNVASGIKDEVLFEDNGYYPSVTYVYDNNGKITEEKISNSNDIYYEYDENGNLIKETLYVYNGFTTETYITEYQYNKDYSMQTYHNEVMGLTYEHYYIDGEQLLDIDIDSAYIAYNLYDNKLLVRTIEKHDIDETWYTITDFIYSSCDNSYAYSE